ncbi:hypothetical protein EVAR_15712_1 [Eumeta japonica]|uniref:Uncharacterized protein n=1 Tax=Eumeta variegata TaxID=151549 RepID=A0A4C1U9Q5_EUMVA|nr:hypothetical protein EVAR_15712_1 [Eumeta japonica]
MGTAARLRAAGPRTAEMKDRICFAAHKFSTERLFVVVDFRFFISFLAHRSEMGKNGTPIGNRYGVCLSHCLFSRCRFKAGFRKMECLVAIGDLNGIFEYGTAVVARGGRGRAPSGGRRRCPAEALSSSNL